MQLIPFSLEFYEDLVDMHYSYVREIYGDKRRINPKYFFYRSVQSWIEKRREIVLAIHKGDVVGYTVSYIDDMDGLTEPVYKGQYVYVKETARKTRAAYLLYNNVEQRAKDLNMNLTADGRVSNGADKILDKHFADNKDNKMFSTYERKK